MSADIEIIVGDITTLAVDAIVNAANEALAPGGGVCGAIFRAAGPGLDHACRILGGCDPGEAMLTAGFNLPAQHVIHAVGPRYQGGGAGEADLLAACYRRSLEFAAEAGLDSIAFPCISIGIFGYPREEAAQIAVATCRAWLVGDRPPHRIICCCFSDDDAGLYRSIQSMK